jgi:1,4-alpha-glucan branching enzyme
VSDTDPMGFQWIEADDATNSVYAGSAGRAGAIPTWSSYATSRPIERPGYVVGLPASGPWREALNTDAAIYGGQGRGNLGTVSARAEPHQDQAARAEVYLPPLSAVFLVQES